MKMRMVAIGVILVFVAVHARAATYYVRPDGDDGANGTSWPTAWRTVTNALAKAAAYDNIWVAAGTYTPGGARTDVFTIGNRVNLYGGFTNGMTSLAQRDWVLHETVLSGEIGSPGPEDNCYRVVVFALVNHAILDGFVVRGGHGAADGAGIYINSASHSTVTIKNCVIEDNTAVGNGGGAWFGDKVQPTLENCVFRNNQAGGSGGGVRAESYGKFPLFSACTFSNNSAVVQGGGLSLRYQKGSVTGCLFVGNRAGLGGGLHIDLFGPLVSTCTFTDNQATNTHGGGVYGNTITTGGIGSSALTGNRAQQYGGGAYFTYGTWALPMVGCTFGTNTATVGGGLAAHRSNVTMTNCIVWGNAASSSHPEIYAYTTNYGVPKISWSNIRGSGGSGAGWDPGGSMAVVDQGNNIDVDPLYVNLAAGDVHLRSSGGHWAPSGWVIDDATSPCIDAGPPVWPVGDEPKPNGDRINMGAYGGTAQASKSPPPGTVVLVR